MLTLKIAIDFISANKLLSKPPLQWRTNCRGRIASFARLQQMHLNLQRHVCYFQNRNLYDQTCFNYFRFDEIKQFSIERSPRNTRKMIIGELIQTSPPTNGD